MQRVEAAEGGRERKQTFVAIVVGIPSVCETAARSTGAVVFLRETRAGQPRKSNQGKIAVVVGQNLGGSSQKEVAARTFRPGDMMHKHKQYPCKLGQSTCKN